MFLRTLWVGSADSICSSDVKKVFHWSIKTPVSISKMSYVFFKCWKRVRILRIISIKSQYSFSPTSCELFSWGISDHTKVFLKISQKTHVLEGNPFPLPHFVTFEECVQVVLEPLILVKWREDVWNWPTDGYVKMNSLPSFWEQHFRCLQILLAYFAIISDSLAWTWIWWKSWWNLKLTWLTDMIEERGEEDGVASAIIKCDDLPSKKYLCCFSWRPTGTFTTKCCFS